MILAWVFCGWLVVNAENEIQAAEAAKNYISNCSLEKAEKDFKKSMILTGVKELSTYDYPLELGCYNFK